MSTPARLYRVSYDGRYLGFIVVDRPIEDYAHRSDLVADQPPDAPIGYHAYRGVDGTWVLQQESGPSVTLEQLKTQKWSVMKSARRGAMQAPLQTPYGTFDADDDARRNIIDTAHLMQTEAQTLAPGTEPTVDFTLADNSVVTLTAGEMVEVALLLAGQIQAAFNRGREVRAAIDTATTVAEVEAVTWEAD